MTEQLRASSHARVMCVGDDCICVVVCEKVLFSFCGRGTQRKDMDWFELMVQGNNDAVEQLVQQGTVGPSAWRDGYGPLHLAAGLTGNVQVSTVETLLAAGFDPNLQEAQDGMTALHICVCGWLPAMTEILVKYGARSSVETRDGITHRVQLPGK